MGDTDSMEEEHVNQCVKKGNFWTKIGMNVESATGSAKHVLVLIQINARNATKGTSKMPDHVKPNVQKDTMAMHRKRHVSSAQLNAKPAAAQERMNVFLVIKKIIHNSKCIHV